MRNLASARSKTLRLLPLLLIVVITSVLPLTPVHANPLWSSPILIDSNNGRNQLSTSLQATNGTLWIAWESTRNAIFTGRVDILYKTYTNGVWSISRNMTTSGQNGSPWLIQLSDGTIGMFWSLKPAHSYEVFYSLYAANGWSTPAQITSTTLNDTQPSAAVARDGTVWLVWTRIDTTNPSIPAVKQLYYKTWKNNVWSSDTKLTTDSNQNYGSAVLIGKDNIVRVAWTKGTASTSYQIYQKTYNGTRWSTENQIISSSSTDEHPSMIQDRNGTLWLFWSRLIVVSQTVQYYVVLTKTSYNMGATWSSETQMTNTSQSVDSYMPSAVQSSYGTKPLWLFYSSNLNEPTYDIYALMSSGIGPIHDVDLTGIYASSSLGTSWAYQGGLRSVGQTAIVTITVTVTDPGDYSQTVSITVNVSNTTSISLGARTGFVGPGSSVNVYFYWNTSGVKPARYSITASVAPVTGESYGNSFDNSLSFTNQMHILPLGDINQDGDVTITDVSVFFGGFNYSSSCNCSHWNPYADINNNGIIDIVDVSIVATNFNTYA